MKTPLFEGYFVMEIRTISVIIPCHDEAEIIADNIRTVNDYLRSRFRAYEIIAVSDGSSDDTVRILEQIRIESPEIPLVLIAYDRNRGKGYAIRQGFSKSRYEAILFLDADLAVSIEELGRFLPHLTAENIVIASRALSETVFEEPVPWYRAFMARGFRFLQMLILGNTLGDTQCGFKLFSRTAAQTIFPRLTVDRFAFDAEIIYLARLFGYPIVELPVTIARDTRNTNVRVIRDPINMLFALIKIRMNVLLDRYSTSLRSPLQ